MRWLLILTLMLSTGCHKKELLATQAELDATRADREAQVAERDAQIGSLHADLAAAQRHADDLDREIARLEADLAATRSELAQVVKDRSKLAASIDEMSQALEELAARKAASEQRIAEFRDLVQRFRALIDAGRLKVKIVDGRMVVEMATDILFASGRADLSPEGKEALAEVAEVLADIPDRRYQIEGHTDDVPIKTDRFPSNWELASARATVVLKELVAGGLSPERLSAASYGEQRPAVANDTPEGRAANRRIEIVVVPDLDLLPGFDELTAIAEE